MTNRERILAALATTLQQLDDDEISRRAGVFPRQTVNQICNQLAQEGLIRRVPGAGGKLVNSLVDRSLRNGDHVTRAPSGSLSVDSSASAARVSEVADAGESAGDSTEQRAAESLMLERLSARLGMPLAPRRLVHRSGARVELDGADPELRVLVECWAHQGPAKVAQKYKLMNDASKLAWVATWLVPRPERLIIYVSDQAAVRHLRGVSWQGQMIADAGVELVVVDLPPEVVATIVEAQQRQFR